MVVLAKAPSLIKFGLIAVMSLAALAISGCAAQAGRPTTSSYGCMRAQRDSLPADMRDEQKHCVASGLIARHCSVSEANMAGVGKEMQDLFGHGDASWADWKMDRKGVACSHDAADDEALARCCAGD